MTAELVAFLRARYDDDFAVAERAAALQDDPEHGWGIVDDSHYTQPHKERWISPHIGVTHEAESAAHIVQWNPARMLADIDAKRRIIAASAAACPINCARDHSFSGSCALRWMGPEEWEKDGSRWVHNADGETVLAPPVTANYVLRLLALPYREHPDYQPDWAPDA